MTNEYFELDKIAENGIFTVPAQDDIDILALREYCKENTIDYADLTDDDISKFKIKNAKNKIS